MESYDSQVYLVKVDYDKKLNDTKKAFIKYKYDGKPKTDFKQYVDSMWKDIDHAYMDRLIQEQVDKVRIQDHTTMLDQQNLPNKYQLNDTQKFTDKEDEFADYIARNYASSKENDVAYLTKRIKEYEDIERTIAYYKNGKVYSMHTPSEYLSMLFNVNMRMASWNQTIKDGQTLGIDLVYLESHPNGCPSCNAHMGQIYSISGKTKGYPSIEEAYNDGVGHPNCKCNFTLWWGWDNVQEVDSRNDLYEPIQKARGLKRDLERLNTNYDLYRYIGNYGEADNTLLKIKKVEDELTSLLFTYQIERYVY